MAEAGVSTVVSQLANLLLQETALLRGVRDQIEWVKTELDGMQGFLKDAESRRRGDEKVESRLREIRDVAYEAEDIIDMVKFMAERQRQNRGFMGSISRYSHKLSELITLHKIGSEVEKIKIKIQNISRKKDEDGISDLGESSAVGESLQSLRQFCPHADDDYIDVIGFENDKKQLVSQLLDQNVKTRCVISIVGMGGLGKTTLARKVYNDPVIRQHFDTFGWVSVSPSYRVIELVKDIMKKVMGIKKKKETTTGITVDDLEKMGEEEVREMLRDFLRGKKYLVVMVDVWTVDVWTEMQRSFPDENNGGRILLTTRVMEVANRTEPCFPPYQLHTLADAESLELFRRKAFPTNEKVPTELEELAQELAKRCGGLPLALVVLGGLLSRKERSCVTWSKVAQSMSWQSSEGQGCLSILGLSYNDLPCWLKPCFLYIAAFPEDSTVSASKLVRLWIAEGFIPQEQARTMEETARDWLDKLVQRCMLQVVERSVASGQVKRVRIHDMLREVGLSEARKEGFIHVCGSDGMAISDGLSNRRAAFHHRINDEIANSSPHLRTLLGFNLDSAITERFLKGLNLLRVLDLEGASYLKKLPEQIGNMIHLRYLGLRGTGLDKLPSTIGHLLLLQTLDVRGTEIKWLSKSFWRIRTLRHLYIHTSMFLSAPMIGDHNNLQTLQIMDHPHLVRAVGATTTPDGPESMLEKTLGLALPNCLASLTLIFFSYPIPGDVIFAKASNLSQLHSLNLKGRLSLKQQQLPDSSLFPPNLIKLVLIYSEWKWDPMLILEKLPNLKLLELGFDAYLGKIMSCSAGGFPKLQQLILHNLFDLEEWSVEDGAMPSLTHLTVEFCRKLKMLPEGLQRVTNLRELKLIRMHREFNDRVRNDDEYKVRHVPSISFEAEK